MNKEQIKDYCECVYKAPNAPITCDYCSTALELRLSKFFLRKAYEFKRTKSEIKGRKLRVLKAEKVQKNLWSSGGFDI